MKPTDNNNPNPAAAPQPNEQLQDIVIYPLITLRKEIMPDFTLEVIGIKNIKSFLCDNCASIVLESELRYVGTLQVDMRDITGNIFTKTFDKASKFCSPECAFTKLEESMYNE